MRDGRLLDTERLIYGEGRLSQILKLGMALIRYKVFIRN